MRLHALVAISILALACAAHASDKAAEPIKLTFAWKLSLDADGRVAQLTAKACRPRRNRNDGAEGSAPSL